MVLSERQDRLERENRRWRRAAVALALGIAAAVLMRQARTAGRVVEAEKFVLWDPGGGFRGALAVLPDGRLALGLSDQNGTRRATLGLKKDGAPYLRLAGPDGRVIWRAPQRGEED